MSDAGRPILDLAIARFIETTGRSPAGVWMAPGRVNLIGEHTDYNQGLVLPFALSQAMHVVAATRSDGRINVTSTPFGTVELDLESPPGPGWGRYPEAAMRAMRADGVALPGMDLVIESEIPAGSGLSSSAALLCAIILAAADLAASPLSPEQVASLAERAETEWVGVPVGIMDPLASMCSTEDHALFLDCRTRDHEQVALHRSTPAGRLSFLIVDTKVSRRLVEGEYARRRQSCEEVAGRLGVAALRDVTPEMLETHRDLLDDTHLRRARHVVTENARVLQTVRLLREQGLDAIGHLLGESHRSLAEDYEVSVPELDLAVAAAVGAGALGARMTGAGFGGCAIALVAEESIGSVTSAVVRAFAERGFAPPSLFEAWPSPGAHRVL